MSYSKMKVVSGTDGYNSLLLYYFYLYATETILEVYIHDNMNIFQDWKYWLYRYRLHYIIENTRIFAIVITRDPYNLI